MQNEAGAMDLPLDIDSKNGEFVSQIEVLDGSLSQGGKEVDIPEDQVIETDGVIIDSDQIDSSQAGGVEGKSVKNDDAPVVEVQSSFAPGTTIGYYPELIGKLTEEHRTLMILLRAMRQACERKNVASLSQHISTFSSILNGHLLVENVRLYIYLQRNLRSDLANREKIAKFRRDMTGIVKAVTDFVTDQSTVVEWAESHFEWAIGEINALEATLIARTSAEEEALYPMYKPVDQYLHTPPCLAESEKD